MIQITPQMRIMVAIDPIDFRRGIDGLANICRAKLSVDPFTGTLFVFRNRRSTAINALMYDVKSDYPRENFAFGLRVKTR
jgi:transposase